MANATNSDKTGVSCYDGAGTFNGRTITAGTGISVSNGTGVSGNPTISADAIVATTYTADSGSATPAANNLNVFGGTGIDTSGATDTLTITASDAVPLTFTADSGSATPAANNLNIVGAGGVTTSATGSTVTITGQGSIDPDFLFANMLEWDDFISGGWSLSDNNLTKLGWYSSRSEIEAATGDAGHPGIIRFGNQVSVGNFTVFTDRSGGTNSPIVLGGGIFTMDWVAKLNALSSGGGAYTTRFGLFDDLTTFTDGIWFEYTHSVNSGNWQIKTRASSTTTTANTNTAATTDWAHYRIQVNAAASSVSFYIDGSEVANSPIVTNIPTSKGLCPGFWHVKTGSSSTLYLDLDLVILHYELTTSRI